MKSIKTITIIIGNACAFARPGRLTAFAFLMAALAAFSAGCGYDGPGKDAGSASPGAASYISVSGSIGGSPASSGGSGAPARFAEISAAAASSSGTLEIRAREISGNIIYGCSYRFPDSKTYVLNIPLSECSPLVLIEARNPATGAVIYQRAPGALPKASSVAGGPVEAGNIDFDPRFSAAAAIALEYRAALAAGAETIIGAERPGGPTSFEVGISRKVKDYFAVIGALNSAAASFARAAILISDPPAFPAGLDTAEMTVTALLNNAAALSAMYNSGAASAGLLLEDPAVTIYGVPVSGVSTASDIEKIVSRMVSSIDPGAVSVSSGGAGQLADSTAEIGAFTPPSHVWTEARNSSEFGGVYGHSLVEFGGSFFMIGGCGAAGPRNSVWRSADGYSWAPATESVAFAPRYAHGCAVFNGKIWIAGGTDDRRVFNDIWSSADGASWKLESAASPFGPRFGHSLVAGSGRLWALGGNSGTAHLNDSWYSSDGSNWVEVNNGAASSRAPGSPARYGWPAGRPRRAYWATPGPRPTACCGAGSRARLSPPGGGPFRSRSTGCCGLSAARVPTAERFLTPGAPSTDRRGPPRPFLKGSPPAAFRQRRFRPPAPRS